MQGFVWFVLGSLALCLTRGNIGGLLCDALICEGRDTAPSADEGIIDTVPSLLMERKSESCYPMGSIV